jgi:hypothetical protein
MARWWENNGEPLADGRLCLVVDPEDGTHKLRTYGRTKEEVLDKLSRSYEHGQRLIGKLRTSPGETAPARAAVAAAPAPSTRLSADEQMTATFELSDPSKAPGAIVRLVQHATGLNLNAMQAREEEQRIASVAEQWENEHPDFHGSLTNRKLLLNTAVLHAGGIKNVTAEKLEDTYLSLLAQGAFTESTEAQPNQSTPQVQPGENPDSRTAVRPRGATTYRSSNLRATAPVASSRPMYTKAQVDAMSADELAEKYNSEAGFADLVAKYSARRATA